VTPSCFVIPAKTGIQFFKETPDKSVIARSVATWRSILISQEVLDCFATLAMTARDFLQRFFQNPWMPDQVRHDGCLGGV
jgi:hypothetical protein